MMPIQYHTSPFIWMLICLLVVLGVFMIWKEWKNKDGKWLVLRLISVVAVIASLAFILLKPSLRTSLKSENVLMLTPFSDSLAVSNWIVQNPTSKIIDLNNDKAYLSEKELSLLNIDTLIWAGVGPKENERVLLKNYPIKYLESSLQFPKTYLDSIQLKDEISLSETFDFSAVLYAEKPNQVIVYKGFTGIEDSIVLFQGSNKISFKEQPKTAGNFTARLVFKSENGFEIEQLNLPIKVKAPSQFSVLMLSSFPQFENRYLKDWLVGQGHIVISRTAISKDKFRDEFFNTSILSVSLGKAHFYDQFNFIFVDFHWLAQASKLEISLLKNAVQRNSQTMMIFPDVRVNQLKALHPSLIFEKQVDGKSLHYQNLEGLKMELSASNNQLKSGNAILKDDESIGKWIKWNGGKIAVLHFTNSYQWILQGNQLSYSAFWSDIMSSLGSQSTNTEWTLKTNWPTTSESVLIDLTTTESFEKLTVTGPDDISTEVVQDLHFREHFHIQAKVIQAGWYDVVLNTDTANRFSFYVSKPNGFNRAQIVEKCNDNLYYFKMQKANQSGFSKKSMYERITLWPFFILFLLSAGFLWLAPRI